METPENPFHVWDCDRLLKFKCPKTWDSLEKTAEADVRHCGGCDQDVHLCRTPSDFVAHAERGHCVAIPDEIGEARHYLGQPSAETYLNDHEMAERSLAWWEDVVARQTSLDAQRMEAIRKTQQGLEDNLINEPRRLATIQQAVQFGGLRCPTCGYDMAEDYWDLLIVIGLRKCIRCLGPLDSGLPGEYRLHRPAPRPIAPSARL